jgi:trimethylamine--corrinoid protein Co-methyltransferase
LGFCLESLIIDNDMLGMCQRCCARHRGDGREPFRLATIRDVCMNGPGHYLGHEQTLTLMQTEYCLPGRGATASRPRNGTRRAGRTSCRKEPSRRSGAFCPPVFPRHVPKAIDDHLLRATHANVKLPGAKAWEW